MRYIIQILVMLGDILLFVAAGYLLFVSYDNPLTYLLIFFITRVWHKQGGFIAWRKETRKKFLANAKEYGL